MTHSFLAPVLKYLWCLATQSSPHPGCFIFLHGLTGALVTQKVFFAASRSADTNSALSGLMSASSRSLSLSTAVEPCSATPETNRSIGVLQQCKQTVFSPHWNVQYTQGRMFPIYTTIYHSNYSDLYTHFFSFLLSSLLMTLSYENPS